MSGGRVGARGSRSVRRDRRSCALVDGTRPQAERRAWDSNPRWVLPHSGFQDRRTRPLCEPSCRPDVTRPGSHVLPTWTTAAPEIPFVPPPAACRTREAMLLTLVAGASSLRRGRGGCCDPTSVRRARVVPTACGPADRQGVTPGMLSAAPTGGSVADAHSPVPVGPRHRAPEPDPRDESADTTVIRADWAAYGRHAAPSTETCAGMPLPPRLLRPRGTGTAAPAGRAELRAHMPLDIGADEDPDCRAPLQNDTVDAPTPGTAPARSAGILRRCLDPWTTQRGLRRFRDPVRPSSA